MDDGDEEPTESATEEDAVDADDPVDDDPEVGPDVVEMEHRLGELEEELERNGGRIETVQHSQEEVAERVEELNETVRDLTGIYERLTADVNPFTDAEESEGNTNGRGNGGGFGVVNGDGERAGAARANGDEDGGEHERAHEPADDTAGDDPVAAAHDAEVPDEEDPLLLDDEPETDDVFTFDDAVADLEREADSDGSTSEGPTGADTPDEDGRASVAPEADAVPPAANGGSSDRRAAGADDRTPYLTELADGYATDVLALEWLAELVEITGPAAALKAISYYEDVDWIGPSVAGDLEEYLAGPGIDVHVDPNEPMELSVEDHVTSYEYILKLGAIRELEHTA